MADNRKLTAGVLMMPEAQRQELARMGDEYKRFKEADYLRKMGEQGAGLAKSVARGVPQMATGLVDLASMPFEAAGVLQPGKAVGSTKWLENRGYLPESQPGFANQLTELLSGGFDPSDLITKGAPMLAALRTTWHGSPHGFTKFDMSKIGTGEGAQAYGHGLYLAEARPVAEEYATNLSKDVFNVGGELFNPADIKHLNVRTLARKGDLDSAINKAAELAASDSPVADLAKLDLDLLQQAKAKGGFQEAPGYLYKVELPDEQIAKMLDWDKPLSQQAPEVQQAFRNTDFYKQAQDYYGQNPKQWYLDPEQKTGESLYQYMQAGIGDEIGGGLTPAQASAYLQQAGIPGIQYLDQASRGAGEGTRNYVVFSDEIPQILERNGQPIAQALRNYEAPKPSFDVTKQDASDIFGEGATRIRYQDPNTQGFIDVLQRPDGTASVLGLEVPEAARGQGVGQSLQQQVLSDFPEMQGQVSSKAAATTAHRLGRRPVGNPEATLDDVFRMIDEDSSVNLVSPEMQKRFNFGG